MNLEELIETAPDHILHHFSCDCAERALLREREEGREPDPRSWLAIEVKRAWIEGKASDEELEGASIAAYDAYAAASTASTASASAASTASASASASAYAAHAADYAAYASAYAAYYAYAAAKDAEIVWQVEHLINLIERHKNTQINLLSALSERQASLSALMDRTQKEMEDVLF